MIMKEVYERVVPENWKEHFIEARSFCTRRGRIIGIMSQEYSVQAEENHEERMGWPDRQHNAITAIFSSLLKIMNTQHTTPLRTITHHGSVSLPYRTIIF